MSVLGVYDPDQCDERGVPLDWERCRKCDGTGEAVLDGDPKRDFTPTGGFGTLDMPGLVQRERCSTCDGHGSLKAAALAGAALRAAERARTDRSDVRLEAPPLPIRCEDCGHPMSEGTWEGEVKDDLWDRGDEFALAWIKKVLALGQEPDVDHVHYSPCDEGCRHGGPVHLAGTVAWDGAKAVEWELRNGWTTADAIKADPQPDLLASWRAVDVRTLGWAADLRPEKLAVLCLRCYVERSG